MRTAFLLYICRAKTLRDRLTVGHRPLEASILVRIQARQLMTFDYLLLLAAKIGFSLLLLLFAFRWFFLLPYLWFIYDRPIRNLKRELYDFRIKERTEASGRGIIQSHLDNIIKSKERLVNEKLDLLETNRKLFIDRVNMFLSVISVNKD